MASGTSPGNIRIQSLSAFRPVPLPIRRTLRGTGSARDLTTEDLVQHAIPVTLDHDVYSAVALTDEELTLDISEFARQVLQPQVRAVAEDLEDGLATEMAAADYATNNMEVSSF